MTEQRDSASDVCLTSLLLLVRGQAMPDAASGGVLGRVFVEPARSSIFRWVGSGPSEPSLGRSQPPRAVHPCERKLYARDTTTDGDLKD